MHALVSLISRPVNNAPLVVWRFFFGVLMLAESWGAMLTGWVHKNLVEPQFTFSFFGFEWLQPLPGYGMYGYFFIMGTAALGVALGWRYRLSAISLALLWSGAYFMQKTSYNNHYYLAVLLCWWMVLLPAHKRASLDQRRLGDTEYTHRYWITLFAKLQLLIVFTYGSIAKFYPGWLNGDFIAHTFSTKTHFWLLGPLLEKEWFQLFITYGAIAFDGLIIPLLWWKPTRVLAFWGLIGFNLFNSAVFHIGIFPYLVLAMTVFFFEPAYIERLFRLTRAEATSDHTVKEEITQSSSLASQFKLLPHWAAGLFVLYFIWQTVLPLRHHLMPGDVTWREEGHRLSWRMMLRSKGGSLRLEVVNPQTGQRERVALENHLTAKQQGQVAVKPDFLYRFVQELKKHYAEQGWTDLEIYAPYSLVYLNGKNPAPLYSDSVNLAQVEWNYWGRNDWVLDHPD